ncbi:MAG: hypothetical protein J2P34_09270, partial [Actinobacteria bacterium]|nr:hypothetical protein [Actinomycetota bacterium]
VSSPAEATTTPQQSDYVAAWADHAERQPSMRKQLYNTLPPKLQGLSKSAYTVYTRAVETSILLGHSKSWSNGGFQRVEPARLVDV